MDDMMTSTRCLQLRAVQSSVVVERVGDFSVATDRNAAARQSASIIMPRWAEPRRHTVVGLCMYLSVRPSVCP